MKKYASVLSVCNICNQFLTNNVTISVMRNAQIYFTNLVVLICNVTGTPDLQESISGRRRLE